MSATAIMFETQRSFQGTILQHEIGEYIITLLAKKMVSVVKNLPLHGKLPPGTMIMMDMTPIVTGR